MGRASRLGSPARMIFCNCAGGWWRKRRARWWRRTRPDDAPQEQELAGTSRRGWRYVLCLQRVTGWKHVSHLSGYLHGRKIGYIWGAHRTAIFVVLKATATIALS